MASNTPNYLVISEENPAVISPSADGRTGITTGTFTRADDTCELTTFVQVPLPRFERQPKSPGTSDISNLAVTPAVTSESIDADLQALIDAWPALEEATKAKVMRLIKKSLV